jgi:GMP synthase (glutamine-hydrolysing)
MKNILVLQHVDAEGLGHFEPLLRERGIAIRWVRPAMAVPALHGVDGVIALGGPMGVYEADRHPRLTEEIALLAAARDRELPILGICLGSQLLAAALGARVTRAAERELGWFDVTRAPAGEDDPVLGPLATRFPALHWHGDVFELPAGAIALASSAQTACQAFRHGRNAWGLLFHLEAGPAEVDAMIAAFPDEVDAGAAVHLREGAARHAVITRAHARSALAAWLETAIS